jgi:hypothetical protein
MNSKYNIGNFGDRRLEKGGIYLTQSMFEEQVVCMRKLGRNTAGLKKIYRFLSNDKVTLEELSTSVSSKIEKSVEGLHVLVIQDTTELNYQAHSGRTHGLGSVGNGKDIGFFLHPALVLNACDAICLGLSSVLCWQRTRASLDNYKKLPIEEKESYRWLETALISKERLSLASKITIIADRESDIYEEWDRIPDEKTYLLNRICRNRRTRQGKLYEELDNFNVAGSFELEVKTRKNNKGRKTRSGHKARLEIRYGEVEILKSFNCTDKNASRSIKLRAIDVRETKETVIDGEEPIHWRLMTTHDIHNFEDARQIAQWYCERWNIEQLFRTLKRQGLNVESSQIETGIKLQKLAIVGVYVATMIMQMVMAREGKDQHISTVFGEYEQKVLGALVKTLEGKTEKQKNPYPPDCLSWASWIIARLGGWSGYKSDSKAGPITMRYGLKKFETILKGWALAKDVSTD